ncbi:hypothetical protein ACJRO7_022049 [Eucalyptus globulus]|uniref:Wax synthase domain-containing protein n=1 Tax=Eucalyptus globulus TaxID=34317 RepID=A0ABD3KM52_EUCGL
METELHDFAYVWISIVAAPIYYRYYKPQKQHPKISIKNSYCYIFVLVPVGPKRLLFFLPMILLFLLLPLHLTLTLAGLTSFFVAWLSIFKLLLLAYRKGPLVPLRTSSPLSFPLFVTIVSLSIKISPSVESAATKNGGGGGALKSLANYVAKCLLLVMMLAYSVHLYIVLEVAMAVVNASASRLIGVRLIGVAVKPSFNEPYLDTSLQDMWGRWWNLILTSILRPSMYDPVQSALVRLVERRWAALPTVLVTFAALALMHEPMLYHLRRKEPTQVIARFFLLQGNALHGMRWWQLPVEVLGLLMLLPLPLRCDAVAKAGRETIAVIEFVKGFWSILRFLSHTLARHTHRFHRSHHFAIKLMAVLELLQIFHTY